MRNFVTMLALGLAVCGVVAWQLDLLHIGQDATRPTTSASSKDKMPELGTDLFKAAADVDETARPIQARGNPIVIPGNFSVIDKLDVPSQIDGQLLFIGTGIPEGAVQAAGLAPFMAEPYQTARVVQGGRELIVFYHPLYKDQEVGPDQMVAMLDPAKVLDELAGKKAKIEAAKAELRAAVATYKEATAQELRATTLYTQKVMPQEEFDRIKLTRIRYYEESISKEEAVKLAKIEAEQMERFLKQHEIRNKIPVAKSRIKEIYRDLGGAVKNLEPIMNLYSVDRLWAEAMVDVYHGLREGMKVTLEPTTDESPLRTFKGHRGEITSVAVSHNTVHPLIVSASEDKTAAVWHAQVSGPLFVMLHPESVRVVTCSPSQPICLTGGADGVIRLFDLEEPALLVEARKEAAKTKATVGAVLADWLKKAKDDEDSARARDLVRAAKFLTHEPFAEAKDAHRDGVTALAFSPDGTSFASGGADGTIKLWQTDGAQIVYPFTWEHGVRNPHQGTITALHFTPQCRLISASRDNTLRVWRLKQKGAQLEFDPILDRSGIVGNLGVSPDGRWMLFDREKELQFLSVHDGLSRATLKNPAGAIPFETLALFSPDGSLLLTAGASEGRLQLWKTPAPGMRGFEVRQFITEERAAVTCAAFAPMAGLGGNASFAVSGTKDGYVYLWPMPTKKDVDNHRIKGLSVTRIGLTVDAANRLPLGIEVANPDGRLKPGRPVTIVIEP